MNDKMPWLPSSQYSYELTEDEWIEAQLGYLEYCISVLSNPKATEKQKQYAAEELPIAKEAYNELINNRGKNK